MTSMSPWWILKSTSGILRAFVHPSSWEKLTFMYKAVLEQRYGIRYIWGEVVGPAGINPDARTAAIRPIFAMTNEDIDHVGFDFCLVACGCCFNQSSSTGDSPWVPSIHHCNRPLSECAHIDERFLEGRRRRILEENCNLTLLADSAATVLIVGAGFIGVEWACELKHTFPRLSVTLIDTLPRCLGPLPDSAAAYCQAFMDKSGIRTVYRLKYDPGHVEFWNKAGLQGGSQLTYIMTGVKASNYFMPRPTLSTKGPGGGGWVLINQYLQVVSDSTRPDAQWGGGRVFAVGDCSVGYVESAASRSSTATCLGLVPADSPFDLPPLPKTGFSAEAQALHACGNIKALSERLSSSYGGSQSLSKLLPARYPWGAGIFVISLGPSDGSTVTGRLAYSGLLAAAHKELVQATKMAHLQGRWHLASLI
eukprot:CAMPEP_0178371524 /NCGR_PEP_ID=MMETSP0689_2-20121128/870_1 /TAXON_ID=160604 /ORGANISM="Amphidinium massartii, Strain CS-259" /LENGTH=421 /DNA_ID=CAMNT_0019991395 /DNA_START=164 /DNA_END=1426 /DNA_ORIENTATION=+